MKEVNSNFNFRGALNAEHYQVHSDLLDAIPTEVASGLGLIGLRNQYVELFKEENSCYLLNRSYGLTRSERNMLPGCSSSATS